MVRIVEDLSTGVTRMTSPRAIARKPVSQAAPVASPEATRKTQVRVDRDDMLPAVPWSATTSHARTATTTVRRAVARWELTPSIPILARTAVSPAKRADPQARRIHMALTLRLRPYGKPV
jgi:hypothetical protein